MRMPERLEAQLKLKYETNCLQMASHNAITAYGCMILEAAGTCQAERPNSAEAATMHVAEEEHKKPRPKYIWQPCRFLSSA